MTGPNITLPLDLPDVNVLGVTLREESIEITLESTLNYAYCRKCGQKLTALHSYDAWVTVQHLPILGRKVFLKFRPKRYRCPDCDDHPTTTQQLAWVEPNSGQTKAYTAHLLRAMVNSTLADVSVKEHVPYDTLVGVLERSIATQVDWSAYRCLGVLGIDEIALKKGHRDFVVIVSARLPTGHVAVLGVLPDRCQATLQTFLTTIPAPLRATIHTACCDVHEAYHAAVKVVLPHARLVVDRFHIARLYRQAADDLRKSELKRLRRTLSPASYRSLKGAMWAFRKAQRDLKPDERMLLETLFALAPSLKTAYGLREELTHIFDTAPGKNKAKRLLRDWQAKVRASGLTCFDTFLGTLDRFWNEITNYFVDHHSSGFVEGLNNKLKVLKRRCYGIFNLDHFFQRIFLDLEGYRLFN